MVSLGRNVTGAALLSNGQTLLNRRMTERQFVEWALAGGGNDRRAEWEDGEVILLSPDNVEHDELFGWFLLHLRAFVQHHDLGSVHGPNFFLRLPRQKRRRLPDLMFVARAAAHRVRFDGVADARAR